MSDRAIVARITRAGMRAVFDAGNSGLALGLTHIEIGTGAGAGYLPIGDETGLRTPFQRVPIGGGEYLSDFEILVQALFEGEPSGWINEVGIYAGDTLFALWSEPESPLAHKSPGMPLVVALTLAVSEIPPDALTIVMGAPSVNISIAGPFAALSAELIRLQRRAVETENARLIPLIQNRWAS